MVVDGADTPESRAKAETLRIVGVADVLLSEEATRSLPAHQLPPGTATLVVRLIDTIRDQP